MRGFERAILTNPEQISALTEAAVDFLQEQGVDARASHHVGLVLDEILTNLMTHGQSLNQPARVKISIGTNKVDGEIIDQGPPFDPKSAPDPALDQPAAERQVGGLGLFLVRKLSCALEYVREGGENRTKFAIARGGG